MDLKRLVQSASLALPLACSDVSGPDEPRITRLQLYRERDAVLLVARTSPAADACGYALDQRGYVPHERLHPFESRGRSTEHRAFLFYAPGPVELTVTAECSRSGRRGPQLQQRLRAY